MEIDVAGGSYRLFALQAEGEWIARAFNAETGERFGIDSTGPTEAVAVQRLKDWLAWHHEHVAALERLRDAERAYHRAVTDRAFGGSDSDALQAGRGSLDQVDRARAALDAVRARRPR